ncbi:hypothetical protein HJFPF1_12543 [Paramyrothecium foliicola]|nr:hypothetical protein HJFPF1_12543 [Paramyrothecium foliicola]
MSELKLLTSLSREPEIKQLPGYPRLKPAYILKINLSTVNPIGVIANGTALTHVETSTGTLETAPGYDDIVEGDVIYGADWLINDPNKEHARPNLKLIIKTKDDVIIHSQYTGVAQFSQPVHDMWSGKREPKAFPFGISSTVHTFDVGDSKYKHLEHKVFVGLVASCPDDLDGVRADNQDPISTLDRTTHDRDYARALANFDGWINPEDLVPMPQCVAQQDQSTWLSAMTKCTSKRCTSHFGIICTHHQWLTQLSCLSVEFPPEVVRVYLPYCSRSVLAKAQLYHWISDATGRTWLVDVGDAAELHNLSPILLSRGYADMHVFDKAPKCLENSASYPSMEPIRHVISSCIFTGTTQRTGNTLRSWEYSESMRSMIALGYATTGYDLTGIHINDGEYFDKECFCRNFNENWKRESCSESGQLDLTRERLWLSATCGLSSLPSNWIEGLKTIESGYIPIGDWQWPQCLVDVPTQITSLFSQCATDACERDSDGYYGFAELDTLEIPWFAYSRRHAEQLQALELRMAEAAKEVELDAPITAFGKFRHSLGRLASHVRAPKQILDDLQFLPHLSNVQAVRLVDPGIPPEPLELDGQTNLPGIVKRLLPAKDPRLQEYQDSLLHLDLKYNVLDRIKHSYERGLNPRVHAEIQILEYFHHRNFIFVDDDPYIGCRLQPPGATEPRTWTKSDPEYRYQLDILNKMIPEIRKETLDHITNRADPVQWHPDSITGITSNSGHREVEVGSQLQTIIEGVEEIAIEPNSPAASTKRHEDGQPIQSTPFIMSSSSSGAPSVYLGAISNSSTSDDSDTDGGAFLDDDEESDMHDQSWK